MILDEVVEVEINPSTIKHYEKLGYIIPKYRDSRYLMVCKRGTKLSVKIQHLTRRSKTRFRVQCEMCKEIRLSSFISLNSPNCSFSKTGQTICNSCSGPMRGKKTKGVPRTKFSGKKNPNFKHGSKGFSNYRSGAKRRNLEFDLSLEEFKDLTNKKCHYCDSATGACKEDNSMTCGIDRKNPSIGYTLENCVPCCGTCNTSKMDMSYDDFIAHTKRKFLHLAKASMPPQSYQQLLELVGDK